VWAMHALMSLRSPVQLDIGAKRFRLANNATGVPIDEEFVWPKSSTGEDFTRPLELPSNCAWKLYSIEPITRPAIVRYPARGREVRIGFESDTHPQAYWGIWINTGGWVHHHHFAIEPTTGR